MSRYEKLLAKARRTRNGLDYREAAYLAQKFGYVRRLGKSGH